MCCLHGLTVGPLTVFMSRYSAHVRLFLCKRRAVFIYVTSLVIYLMSLDSFISFINFYILSASVDFINSFVGNEMSVIM